MSKKAVPVTQLSLFESDPEPVLEVSEKPFTFSVSTESKEEFEFRRVGEMAEKLGFPALQLSPIRDWPGITISQGEEAWLDVLGQGPSGMGLIMLALLNQIQPLTPGCIDEKGFHKNPAEVLSLHEEKQRSCMLQLAGHLDWPHISYYVANNVHVFGPGEEAWRKYSVFGCFGLVVNAICALERRLSGEPDRTQKTSRQQGQDDDDE